MGKGSRGNRHTQRRGRGRMKETGRKGQNGRERLKERKEGLGKGSEVRRMEEW